jgi:hypothetical protein
MVSINIDFNSLTKGSNGSITGNIYIQIHSMFFPEAKWNDFVIIIINWWLDEINSIVAANNKPTKGIFHFMDGPFYFILNREEHYTELVCVERKKQDMILYKTSTEFTEVYYSILNIGKRLYEICKKEGWNTDEVKELAKKLN